MQGKMYALLGEKVFAMTLGTYLKDPNGGYWKYHKPAETPIVVFVPDVINSEFWRGAFGRVLAMRGVSYLQEPGYADQDYLDYFDELDEGLDETMTQCLRDYEHMASVVFPTPDPNYASRNMQAINEITGKTKQLLDSLSGIDSKTRADAPVIGYNKEVLEDGRIYLKLENGIFNVPNALWITHAPEGKWRDMDVVGVGRVPVFEAYEMCAHWKRVIDTLKMKTGMDNLGVFQPASRVDDLLGDMLVSQSQLYIKLGGNIMSMTNETFYGDPNGGTWGYNQIGDGIPVKAFYPAYNQSDYWQDIYDQVRMIIGDELLLQFRFGEKLEDILNYPPEYEHPKLEEGRIFLKLEQGIFSAPNSLWLKHAAEGVWANLNVPGIGMVPVFDAVIMSDHWQRVARSIVEKTGSKDMNAYPFGTRIEDLMTNNNLSIAQNDICVAIGCRLLKVKNATFYLDANGGDWGVRVINGNAHITFFPDINKSAFWRDVQDKVTKIKGSEWMGVEDYGGQLEHILGTSLSAEPMPVAEIARYIDAHYRDSWDVVGDGIVISKITPGKSPYASDGPLYKYYLIDHVGEKYNNIELQKRAKDQETLYVKLLNRLSDEFNITDAKMILDLSVKNMKQKILANDKLSMQQQRDMLDDLEWAELSARNWIDRYMVGPEV